MSLPNRCPSCAESLYVETLRCPACRTTVQGTFQPCVMCRLEEEDRALLDLFLRARGNLKEVQRELGVSYPTVRSRMEKLWIAAGYASEEGDRDTRAEVDDVLAQVRRGDLGVDQAEARLRRLTGRS